MHLGGSSAANEKRNIYALSRELLSVEDHFVEARRNETGKTDNVSILLFAASDDISTALHDAHVDDAIVVAAEDNADNVFANIVNVTLHSSKHNCSIVLRLISYIITTIGIVLLLLFLHEGRQIVDGALHHASAHDYLRQEHLTASKVVANDRHAVHQGSLNHMKWPIVLLAGFLSIGINELDNALDQGMFEPLFDVLGAPLIDSLFLDCAGTAGLRSLQIFSGLLCHGDKTLHMLAVFTLVPDDLFQHALQLRLHIIVNRQFSSIDDPHIHTVLDGMVEEDRVEGFAQFVQTAEGEREVREATTDVDVRASLLDELGSLNEVLGVIVVLFHARGDCQDVQVEYDVLWREVYRL